VVTEEGEVYPCEILNQSLGSLRENDYDIKKILNSQNARKTVKKIVGQQCACTHEFNLPDNILYSVKGMKMLLREWRNLRFSSLWGEKILEFNVFDMNYAAYIRSRKIRDFLKQAGYKVIYSEANYQGKEEVLSISQKEGLWGYLTALLKRAHLTARLDYDILFLHQFSPLTVPLMLIGKLRGKKVVFDWDDLGSATQSSLAREWLCRLSEIGVFIRRADLIISHNQSLLKLAQEKGNPRSFYVPQGVDTNLFNLLKYKAEADLLKKKLKLAGKKVLIYTAHFNTGGVWDLDVILEAFKKAEQEKKNLFLLIIGGGSLLPGYEMKAKENGLKNYQFLGPVSHQKVPLYLSLADAGLVFMRDNLGNRMKMSLKTLEYLSMPIPVIGHLVGATNKAVGKYIYEAGIDSASLARAIKTFFTLKRNIQPSSRQEIIKNYDWQVAAEYLSKAFKPKI